jgi:hypothetical protein
MNKVNACAGALIACNKKLAAAGQCSQFQRRTAVSRDKDDRRPRERIGLVPVEYWLLRSSKQARRATSRN